MLGVLIAVWLPMVAVVALVTMPFDRGRYAAGWLFRRLTVVHQRLNPMWHFRVVGELPPDPRRPYVVVANHESFVDILLDLPPALGDEVAGQGPVLQVPGRGLADAHGRRHPARARRPRQRHGGDGAMPRTGSMPTCR